jgi:hypothetical protein
MRAAKPTPSPIDPERRPSAPSGSATSPTSRLSGGAFDYTIGTESRWAAASISPITPERGGRRSWRYRSTRSSRIRIGRRLVLSLDAALSDRDQHQADTHQHRSTDDQRDVLAPFLHGVRDQREG